MDKKDFGIDVSGFQDTTGNSYAAKKSPEKLSEIIGKTFLDGVKNVLGYSRSINDLSCLISTGSPKYWFEEEHELVEEETTREMKNLHWACDIDGVLLLMDGSQLLNDDGEKLFFPNIVMDYEGDKPEQWGDLLEQQASRILEIANEMKVLAHVSGMAEKEFVPEDAYSYNSGYFSARGTGNSQRAQGSQYLFQLGHYLYMGEQLNSQAWVTKVEPLQPTSAVPEFKNVIWKHGNIF